MCNQDVTNNTPVTSEGTVLSPIWKHRDAAIKFVMERFEGQGEARAII